MADIQTLFDQAICRTSAGSLVHGAVAARDAESGYVVPSRFTTRQVAAVSSCMSWHPGICRQMATTTAGITVEFSVRGTCAALEVAVDAEPEATARSLRLVDGANPADRMPHDGISVDVDGNHLPPVWPDDYLYFGQTLSYGYDTRTHQDVPSSYDTANRVLRAPAYFRSWDMNVAHFNPDAVLTATEKLTTEQIAANTTAREAYKNMTAIDFTGYNDADRNYDYLEGW